MIFICLFFLFGSLTLSSCAGDQFFYPAYRVYETDISPYLSHSFADALSIETCEYRVKDLDSLLRLMTNILCNYCLPAEYLHVDFFKDFLKWMYRNAETYLCSTINIRFVCSILYCMLTACRLLSYGLVIHNNLVQSAKMCAMDGDIEGAFALPLFLCVIAVVCGKI